MTTPSRYAVPLASLLAEHVAVEQQVQEQAQVASPYDAARWGGVLPLLYGDGGGHGGGGCGAAGCGGDGD